MHDPYFDATVADIRGFDLGDDAPVLAALEAAGPGLPPSDRLLRAVLRLRDGQSQAALDDLEAVAAVGHALSVARYLQAGIAAGAGRLDSAAAFLERARAAAKADTLVPEADLCHAEGVLAWRRGEIEDALARVALGLDHDDTEPRRWMDRASLAALLSRPDEQRSALERALELDHELATAHWELAIALLGTDHTGDAERHFDHALRLDPGLRLRVHTDVRLSAARDRPELAARLGPPAAPDRRWLDTAPSWLATLLRDPTVTERSVTALGSADRDRLGSALRETWATGPVGTLHTAATLQHARERLARMRPVALGPGARTREGAEERTSLWLDEADPTRLWLALSEAVPPFLWIDAGADPTSVTAALDGHVPRPAWRRGDLTRTVRGFFGYAGQLVVPSPYGGELETAGIAELERHFSLSPFLEAGAWGSAFAEDPWPDVIPAQPGLALKLEARGREVAAQAEGHPWSMSWRLRFSRSHFTLEVHHDELFVVEVRYRPSPHGDVVATMNATFGCDYPLDLPLDAIATLLGFPFDGATDLEPILDASEDPAEIAGILLVLSALRHSELDAHVLWRRFAAHPHELVRTTVANIALAYNFESLLEERSLLEHDPGLRTQIEEALDAGIDPPDWDPWARAEEDTESPEDDTP